MFSKLFTVITFVAFTTAMDEGLFAGLKQGVFLPDEASIEKAGCHVPEEPESFVQMKAMIPMVKMMATNMNNGEEPEIMHAIEKALHQLAIIFAVFIGKGYESEFCRGLILAEEGRTLAMMFGGDFIGNIMGSGHKQQKPKIQQLMNQ